MKFKWIGLSLLAPTLAFVSPVRAHPIAPPATPIVAGAAQDRSWDSVPDDFRDARRQGFQEGIEAARHDVERHRHADADDHQAFRHPPVPRELRDDYRDGFRRGYERAMAHLRGDRDHDHDHD